MMLDQLLIKESMGKYGLKHLVQDLMNKYGPDKPFEDEVLFKEIVSLSYPKVNDFINSYIVGLGKLPLKEYMDWYGYNYIAEQSVLCYFVGSFSYSINDNYCMEITSNDQTASLPSLAELRKGDIITEVNNIAFDAGNYRELITKYFKFNESSPTLTLKIIRGGKELVKKVLTIKGYAIKKHQFVKKSPIGGEKVLFDAWIKGKYVSEDMED